MAALEQEGVPPDAILSGPLVPGHHIQHNARAGTFFIDQTLISCTPAQYRVLLALLEQAERCLSYAQFIACMDGGPHPDAASFRLAKDRLMHQISRLRAKLWTHGLDIACVIGVGYLLLRTEDHQSEAQPDCADTRP